MNNDRWEDTLEELCESPEELEHLKETASLFAGLAEVNPSPSFQNDLKERLLSHGAAMKREQKRRNKLVALFDKFQGRQWQRSRSLGMVAAAAVLLIFFAGSVLRSPAPYLSEPEAGGTEKLPEGMLLVEGSEHQPEDNQILTTETPAEESGQSTTEKPAMEIEVEEIDEIIEEPVTEAGEDIAPPSDDPVKPKPQEPAERPTQREEDRVTEKDEEVVPSLPDEPDFEVYKNRRTFTVAGNVLLDYGSTADEQYPVEQVRYNWEPNKFAPAADNGHAFASTEWAGKLLADEGFRVSAGAGIELKQQETTQGRYAEITYHSSPALVLHAHEEKGILAYYYEEKGTVAPRGFYPLLSPADALKQQFQILSSVDGRQLHFSFREVSLTYHEFMVEKDGAVKKVRLPAYRFSGGEMIQGKETVTFYVPAIKH